MTITGTCHHWRSLYTVPVLEGLIRSAETKVKEEEDAVFEAEGKLGKELASARQEVDKTVIKPHDKTSDLSCRQR